LTRVKLMGSLPPKLLRTRLWTTMVVASSTSGDLSWSRFYESVSAVIYIPAKYTWEQLQVYKICTT
jgi:hypothetical protein